MGAEQSTESPTKRKIKRNSSSSIKYVPPSDGYLDEYTVYNRERTYSTKELTSGSKVLAKRLKKLEAQITSLSANDGKGFRTTYEGIKDGNNNAAKASKQEVHRELNRYTNIVAYDSTRVKVKPNDHNGGTDYINANYISGYKAKKMYIAAQGPVPASIYAFWQMLMEQQSNIIVMVTNLTEGSRLKCHQYWPQLGTTDVVGDITVKHVSENVGPLMVLRKFQVSRDGETRDVQHFQYTAWPDHGVPNTTEELLRFRHTVREAFTASMGPIITHCSAGVGRTGTFIGLDRYLDSCSELDESLTVLDIVKDMRKSRNFMVQAQAQFEYLYMACYDGLVVLLEKINRDLQMANMSEEERQVMRQQELAADVEQVTERFWARCHGLEFKPGQVVVPDVKHSLPAVRKEEELAAAAQVKPATRLASLAKSKEIWTERGNVPMDAESHGYKVETAPIETRLGALSESRLNWTKCYDEAVKTWASAQDHEGVLYDIGYELTSLESRVGSLAAAETAWMLRSDGKRSVQQQMQAEKMAAVTARLQSLQSEIVNADARWRSRGDGFRTPEDEEAAAKAHTVDALGGLTSRLRLLQMTQNEWVKRGNVSKFDEDKFFTEIATIEETEGAAREARMADLAAEKEKKEAAAAKLAKDEAERKSKEQAMQKEKEKNENKKSKMRQKAAIQEEWSAEKARQERLAKVKAEEDAKQKAVDAEKAAAAEAAAKEKAKKETKAKAANKASKFLKHQSR